MSDKAIVHTLCRNSVNVSKSGNDKINKARDLLQESTGSFFLINEMSYQNMDYL